jgi:hypothetical protein
MQYPPSGSVLLLLCEGENGPIAAAKTHVVVHLVLLHTGGYPKFKRQRKGTLSVFGIYDYTNDQMRTHGWIQKENSSLILSKKRAKSMTVVSSRYFWYLTTYRYMNQTR